MPALYKQIASFWGGGQGNTSFSMYLPKTLAIMITYTGCLY